MKVLFLRSGNRGIDPISTRQGESLRKAGVEVIYYDIIGSSIAGYLRNILPVRRYIIDARADLVHAHYSLSGFVAGLSCSGKGVVTSLMGSDVLDCGPFMLFLTRFFSKFVWDMTIVKTAEMHTKLGVKRAVVIPNGIDMEMFFPYNKHESQMSLGWNINSRHILFGSDPQRPEKNYDLAQKALSIVNEKYPTVLIEVHFLNNIDSDKTVTWFCASDLLLMTSTHEGSSNTIKEAMACNCPIVTTDTGDAREVIAETEGCFVTSFYPEDVAVSIFKALTFGRRTNGREKAARLNNEIISMQILDMYNRLLKT